jgi:hypothetical protein
MGPLQVARIFWTNPFPFHTPTIWAAKSCAATIFDDTSRKASDAVLNSKDFMIKLSLCDLLGVTTLRDADELLLFKRR